MLTEAQRFWDAIKSKVLQICRAETKNTLRMERYTVTTAPDGSVVGVTLPFGTTELMLPYSKEVAEASVGDVVLVAWWGSMSNAKVYYFANGYEGSSDGGGGGGTSDYADLTNKPSINNVTLAGNKTAAQLGLGTYTKPSGGIPATDIAAGVIPSPSSATPQNLGTAAAGSSTDYSRADHVHNKPTYTKSDVGLGNVDNVQQYSASNPPPYPVTSVNGSTGAVTVSVPSAATATPAALGTAAVGTSSKYAKEDHVHAMPTAANVGAIADPGGGSTGQVLKKTASGTEWANESGGGGGVDYLTVVDGEVCIIYTE